MGINSLVVAIGQDTQSQINAIARTVLEMNESTEVRVIIAHVLRGRRDTALTDLDEQPKTPVENRFSEQLPAHPGTEGDFPEWVRRWSQRRISGDSDHDRDQEEQIESEAMDRILARKDALQQLVDAFETAGIEYELRGVTGDPVDQIGLILEEVDADFLVVSSRDRSRIQETLFGSLAQTLLRSAPCPVITVREDIYE